MPTPQAVASAVSVESARDAEGRPALVIAGRLDSSSAGGVWQEALELARAAASQVLVVDASGLEYCDGAGATLLLELGRQQEASGGRIELRGLREETAQLVRMLAPSPDAAQEAHGEQALPAVAALGRSALELVAELRKLVVFVGELSVMLMGAVRRPAQVRWRDVFVVAERAGIGATPIIMLVGFLLGLILSFQSAIPMKRFGAQIFVADLLGISMFRELGPLMAAILLTARSGSAFAAELGTMKVNEEIDALSTMGLEPVRFLVVPRVIAALMVVPVLTMIMNLSGMVGGAVVFLSLDFPLVTYVNRVVQATAFGDLAGGLFKAFVFGVIVAGVGCMRGLQTGTGAGAVGQSTTSSVVSGIILIAFASALFAVIFYVLEI